LKPSEDQLEGLKRLLNEVCCAVLYLHISQLLISAELQSSLSTCVTLRQWRGVCISDGCRVVVDSCLWCVDAEQTVVKRLWLIDLKGHSGAD